MRKMRKGKKMLLILIIAILVAIIAGAFMLLIDKAPGEHEKPEDVQQVIPLPETTYSDMQVKNIQMEYLKDNNETMISMEIHNTTKNKVEKEKLDAVLVGPGEDVLGQIQTYILNLEPGEQYDISVILKGDLTATELIKLIKK